MVNFGQYLVLACDPKNCVIIIAHKKSHGTNVVVVNNQSVNSKMAANLFYCHLIGCLQQQHSLRRISCGLCSSRRISVLIIEFTRNADHTLSLTTRIGNENRL